MAEQTAQAKAAPKRSRPPGALAVITATLGLYGIWVRAGRPRGIAQAVIEAEADG